MKIFKYKVVKTRFLMAGTSVGYTDYREGRSRMKVEDDMVEELIAEDKPVVMNKIKIVILWEYIAFIIYFQILNFS